jgi:hypothetical protein
MQPAGSGIGKFDKQWLSQPRHMTPFVIDDPTRYVAGPPPKLTSGEYRDDYNEVKYLGDKNRVDPAADATYNFWALGGKSDQPPGAWLQVAQAVSAQRSLSLADTARLFALQSMAMADTVGATYETKYRYDAWRPTAAIRAGDSDSNPKTIGDPAWTNRAGTVGSSPQHFSGHSSFSAAGAAVLAGFFCTDAVTFTLDTDDTATTVTPPRTYSRFSTAALEAGQSRVLGGLHFQFSNTAGLISGVRIASEVLSTALRPASGPASNC